MADDENEPSGTPPEEPSVEDLAGMVFGNRSDEERRQSTEESIRDLTTPEVMQQMLAAIFATGDSLDDKGSMCARCGTDVTCQECGGEKLVEVKGSGFMIPCPHCGETGICPINRP
jgi:membrane protease subunit (stomatin/prohibitin family)